MNIRIRIAINLKRLRPASRRLQIAAGEDERPRVAARWPQRRANVAAAIADGWTKTEVVFRRPGKSAESVAALQFGLGEWGVEVGRPFLHLNKKNS